MKTTGVTTPLKKHPAIRSPDIIIVSGDIIHGIRPDTPDPEEKLREQYQEALDFLAQLTDRFVGGDRNRVIVVPGNHDVSAYHLEKSLRRVDILPDRKKGLVTQLFSPDSLLRWSWSGFELYEIADQSFMRSASLPSQSFMPRFTTVHAPTTSTLQDRSTFSIFPRSI